MRPTPKPRSLLAILGVLCSLAVTGCLSPITLTRAVTAYDEAITDALARWNREAFQMLYLLFQMTVSEVPHVGVPSITIAK